MDNPFKYGGVVSGTYFVDREQEMDELVREMMDLSRIFLVSPRRFGKTCLLYRFRERLEEKGVASAYLDLNAYPCISSFAAAFAHLTSQAIESNAERLLKLFGGLKRLRPKVFVGPDGSISAGLEPVAGDKEAIPALLEAMDHAEGLARKKGRKLVVIIDEFSDLVKYNGETLEKAMRSEIQQHQHIGYILSGSQESVMVSLTRDRKRAFYKLGRIMELGPIAREAYAEFILGWFRKGSCPIDRRGVDRILDLGGEVPYNVQRLCHALWDRSEEAGKVAPDAIEELPRIIAGQDSPHFEMLWQSVSAPQKALLEAMAREPDAKPFSRDFQLGHGIGPSSSIKASLESLTKKGILQKTREGSYRFADLFMRHWVLSLGEPQR
ncbi:MAG: ATP-binding protein [Thermodesulfobacteriota bacterium]